MGQIDTNDAAEDLQILVDDPHLLEERDDSAELVPRLPAQSFVRMARQLRDDARLDLLLPHATPEQLTSLLDLDAWRGDRLDVARARGWVCLIAECIGAVHERGELVRIVQGMDPEMWTFALLAGTLVEPIDAEDDESREAAIERLGGCQIYETPDGFFLIGVSPDELGSQTIATIFRVYEDSLTLGRRLVQSIAGGLASQLEEDLLRWRSGRLADLGFVEWDEAMRLFRPLDREAALTREPAPARAVVADSVGAPVVPWREHGLLRRVMERLEPAQHGLRSREFLLLVNEVISAQRFDPGDEALQQRAIDQTQATLALALELLAAGRPDHPDPDALLAERVVALGLRDLFRVGYGALDKLRKAALALHRSARISLAGLGSLLDRPWGAAVAALGRWYPELPLESGTGTRPLRSVRDVRRATDLLAEAAALTRITFDARGYGVDPVWIARADEPERLRLGDLVRTAVVHAHLPGSSPVAPSSADDLAWAHTHLLHQGRLTAIVRDDFRERCRAIGAERQLEVLENNLLTRLEVELAALEFDDGKVNLERIGGLLTIQTVSMWLKTTAGVD